MCLIIDANMCGRFFATPASADFVPVWQWLEGRDGAIVFGGRNARELWRVANAGRAILELHRRGKAHRVEYARVDKEEARLAAARSCRSDDPHVIALARIGGSRLLCSEDADLHADFSNTTLLSDPKGRIYQNAGHKGLLRKYGHTKACRMHPH